jgi:hypothetical protein
MRKMILSWDERPEIKEQAALLEWRSENREGLGSPEQVSRPPINFYID